MVHLDIYQGRYEHSPVQINSEEIQCCYFSHDALVVNLVCVHTSCVKSLSKLAIEECGCLKEDILVPHKAGTDTTQTNA